jgi:hypothetical protein
MDNIFGMEVFKFLDIQFLSIWAIYLYRTGKARVKAADGAHYIYAINLTV